MLKPNSGKRDVISRLGVSNTLSRVEARARRESADHQSVADAANKYCSVTANKPYAIDRNAQSLDVHGEL